MLQETRSKLVRFAEAVLSQADEVVGAIVRDEWERARQGIEDVQEDARTVQRMIEEETSDADEA